MDLDNLFNEVINDAISIGFPVSKALDRKIYWDKKRYDRVGACYRYSYPERYEIHLSENVKAAKINEVKNILAHEVLHANFLSMNHGYVWLTYKNLMNNKLGYDIKVEYSWYKILKQ